MTTLDRRSPVNRHDEPEALFAVDSLGRIIHDTPRATRLLGYGSAELVGARAVHLVHPADRSAASELLSSADAPEPVSPLLLRFRHRSGHWTALRTGATSVDGPHGIAAVLVVHRGRKPAVVKHRFSGGARPPSSSSPEDRQMIRRANQDGPFSDIDRSLDDQHEATSLAEEIERLRAENRRLAISLGGFSAFMASRGLLEEAWHYVHNIHQIDDGVGVAS